MISANFHKENKPIDNSIVNLSPVRPVGFHCFLFLLLLVILFSGCSSKQDAPSFDEEFELIQKLPNNSTPPSDALELLAKNDQDDRNSPESLAEMESLIRGKRPQINPLFEYRDSIRLAKATIYKNLGEIKSAEDKFNAGIVFIHGDTSDWKIAYDYFAEVETTHHNIEKRKKSSHFKMTADRRLKIERGDIKPQNHLIIRKQ